MHPLASPLHQRILEEIAASGPIPFDRFFELALYDPEEGYYNRPGRIGEEGDFVTGPSWHPAFARCLVRHLRGLKNRLGPPVSFVDFGCGDGALLRFMADALVDEPGIALLGVERSPVRRKIAAKRVPEARFLETLESPVRGWIFGYELVDALPVRSYAFDDEGLLFERRVGASGDGSLVFVAFEVPDPSAVLTPLWKRGASFSPQQLFEVRPGAAKLVRSLAAKLAAGQISLFDYGASTRALYGPARENGTLEAFTGHRVTRDVLTGPGGRDITAWVDFSELEEAFRSAGLVVHGLVSQARLLAAAGIAEELAAFGDGRPPTLEEQRERDAVLELVRPGGMGESLRVLVAEKGTAIGPSLCRWPGREDGAR